MTDRHAGYLITLERDIREDDAEATIAALRQVKGVLTVQPVPFDTTLAMAEDRAKHEIGLKLITLLRP